MSNDIDVQHGPPNAMLISGMPTRPTIEPIPTLEQVHALVAATFASRSDADRRKLRQEDRGLDVTIFDTPQIANLAALSDQEGLKPGEITMVLDDLDDHVFLEARWESLRLISERIIRIYEAVVKAIGLEKVHPISVNSMQEDPRKLWHTPGFRTELASVWGNRDVNLSALSESDVRLVTLLERLIPSKYRSQNRSRADALLSYGLMELAAIMHAVRNGITLLQYDNHRERGYLQIAQALRRRLGLPAEFDDHFFLLNGISGMELTGGETDSYRIKVDEISKRPAKRTRLSLNPTTSVEDLKAMLLNGEGKFERSKGMYIVSHVMKLLDRLASAKVGDFTNEEQHRIRKISRKIKNTGIDSISSGNASFILEMLQAKVSGPIGSLLGEQNLLYIPESIPPNEVLPDGNGGSSAK